MAGRIVFPLSSYPMILIPNESTLEELLAIYTWLCLANHVRTYHSVWRPQKEEGLCKQTQDSLTRLQDHLGILCRSTKPQHLCPTGH